MNWSDIVKTHGLIEWPYPIRYYHETEVEADVLVLGGGIAGCWAAISAARKGVKVALVEKGATIKSGSGGSGCDHWLNTPHPGSPVTAEEVVEWELEMTGGYTNALSRYIAARESYETLLEMEKMGGKIRDTEDEFKGAPFRDEETGFLFAYDYESKIHFRVWGSTFKMSLHKECKELGIRIYDRIMATGLLTEGGKSGARVTGAVGVNARTGEFMIFKAKAVINCMSRHQRNWCFSTELRGNANFRPTQIVGDGHAMAWRAGAEFTMMERSLPTSFASGDVLQPYSHGNGSRAAWLMLGGSRSRGWTGTKRYWSLLKSGRGRLRARSLWEKGLKCMSTKGPNCFLILLNKSKKVNLPCRCMLIYRACQSMKERPYGDLWWEKKERQKFPCILTILKQDLILQNICSRATCF